MAFFQVPIICALLTALLIAVCTPVAIATAYRYSPDRINIEFTEKEIISERNGDITVSYTGTITNKGSAKVEQIDGILYIKDKNGENIFSDKIVINVPFSIPSPPDNYLEKNESWDFIYNIYLASDHISAFSLRDMELDDTEMVLEVTSIRYKTNGSVDFSNQLINITTCEN